MPGTPDPSYKHGVALMQSLEARLSDAQRQLARMWAQLGYSEWQKPVSLSGKVNAANANVFWRHEQGGSVLRLSGSLELTGALASEETIFTLPAGTIVGARFGVAGNEGTDLITRITILEAGGVLWYGTTAGIGSILGFETTVRAS